MKRSELAALASGLALVLAGVFVAVSLLTWDVRDPQVLPNYEAPPRRVLNRGGEAGAIMASFLFRAHGVVAYAVPVAMLALGGLFLARRSTETGLRRAGGAAVLIVALTLIAGTRTSGFLARLMATRSVDGPGGAFGAHPIGVLASLVGGVGTYLVILFALGAGMLLISREGVERGLAALGRWAIRVGPFAAALARRVLAVGARRSRRPSPEEVFESVSRRARAIGGPALRPPAETPPAETPHAETPPEETPPAETPAREYPPEDRRPDEPERITSAIPIPSKPSIKRPEVRPARHKAGPKRASEASTRRMVGLKAKGKRKLGAAGLREASPAPGASRGKSSPASSRTRRSPRPVAATGAASAKDAAAQVARPASPRGRPSAPQPVAGTVDRHSASGGEAPPAGGTSGAPSGAARASSRSSGRIPGYLLPPVELLLPEDLKTEVNPDEIAQRGVQIVRTLSEFQIEARLVGFERGPATTMYELALGPGINVNRVLALANNLAMAVMSNDVRVVAPIPGRSTIGVEVPNLRTEIVRMRPLLESEDSAFVAATAIPLLLGRDTSGGPLVSDLTAMPHLLIAGTTGSGKSVCMDAIIMSILMLRRPDEVRLLLIDPKMVEFSRYRDVPHLVSPVVTDVKRAAGCLDWAVREMQERYAMLNAVGARDIGSYNGIASAERRGRARASGAENSGRFDHQMPHVVIMVDELSDLMMQVPKEVEESMRRLAQKSRATGIHMVLATQRPSVDVITGTIRANFPCRIAFQVAVSVDSRVIIGRGGAERLLGKGDMLFVPPARANPIRAKGVYVAEEEIGKALDHIRKQPDVRSFRGMGLCPPGDAPTARRGNDAAPGTAFATDMDSLYEEAVRIVLGSRRGSVSLLQRRLGVGYTRAGKLIDIMAAEGLIGPYKGSKPRDIRVTLKEWEARRAGAREGGGLRKSA